MIQRRFRWAAVAAFAAVMTVAEVFAISAGARDAKRWLESDSVREVQQAGRAVAAAVTGAANRECDARGCVKVRVVSPRSVRQAVREARRQIEEVRAERMTDTDIEAARWDRVEEFSTRRGAVDPGTSTVVPVEPRAPSHSR